MLRHALVLLLGLVALVALSTAAADEGDKTTIARTSMAVGEQVAVRLEVVTPAGQSVELNPGGPSWNDVELVRVTSATTRTEGANAIHTIDIVVAPFTPGAIEFQPAVTVISGAEATPRLLPVQPITVQSILKPGEPLEISPLAPTQAITGAESPLLRPAIALGVVVGVLLVAGLLFLFIRKLAARPAPATPPGPAPALPPTLQGAEQIITSDPVAAYRTLASVVRAVIGSHYGFPAPSLTTHELKRRMESAGVDRWQARLVEGLLEECDAVIYAGYRPATARRMADLTMAREIVEAVS